MHPGPLRRTVAQPCEKYFVKVAALHERIRAMRTEDMTMRAIAEREGVSTRAVHYAIHKNDPPRTPDTPQAPQNGRLRRRLTPCACTPSTVQRIPA